MSLPQSQSQSHTWKTLQLGFKTSVETTLNANEHADFKSE